MLLFLLSPLSQCDQELLRLLLKMEADISIKQITQTYSLFYEDERELTDEENESIRLCCDLFRHITTSTEPLSTSQQYRRIRARNLLTEVYLKVGAEVFLLCMLTWSITALARFDSKIVLPKFLQWWKSTPTKEGLKRTADKICNDYGIKKLVKQVKTFSGSMHVFFNGVCSVWILS